MKEGRYVVGIISGTSMDAVDCVLADLGQIPPRLVHSHREPLAEPLRSGILELCQNKPVSLQTLGETDVAIGRLFATAINNLLQEAGMHAREVLAVGSHGQTVQHQPVGQYPFTMQLGDPSTIAALTGITTVADFRRKDMAAGGQGAPLAPLFHEAVFAQPDRQRVVLNLGGIANISVLTSQYNPRLTGFDTGPANVLMDTWINMNLGHRYDADGAWAARGQINEALLRRMLQEPYLSLPPPKSTGRELFNRDWLENLLDTAPTLPAEDVQATLLEFTAQTVISSVQQAAPRCAELIACGGGTYNKTLMNRLQELLPDAKVAASESLGLGADWVEAMTFAWIAGQTLQGVAIDCTSVTGARHPCILGGIYSAET